MQIAELAIGGSPGSRRPLALISLNLTPLIVPVTNTLPKLRLVAFVPLVTVMGVGFGVVCRKPGCWTSLTENERGSMFSVGQFSSFFANCSYLRGINFFRRGKGRGRRGEGRGGEGEKSSRLTSWL